MQVEKEQAQAQELTFPVAETFYSIQGEGMYAGTPMFFIRLAGCNVGKHVKLSHEAPDDDYSANPFQLLHPEHTTCTSYSGAQFVCDTDYRVKERMTIQDLLAQIPTCGHVSITGGEPLIHKHLADLVIAIGINTGCMVHLETSGTLDLGPLCQAVAIEDGSELWVTCSPKQGYLEANLIYINQFKFLVENDHDVEKVSGYNDTNVPIFIQPIEHYDANGPIKSSYDFVVDVVKKNPTWRLSIQVHKILGVR